MTTLSVTPKQASETLKKMYREIEKELPITGRQLLFRTMLIIRNRMGKRGTKPTYPIKWVSDRQRRKFFATSGFGHGIPTVRSNAYTDSWKVTKTQNKEGYSIINDKEYAKFVGGNAYGLNQSPIHMGRWQLFRDVFEEEIETLPEDMLNEMYIVGRRIVREA